MSSTFGKINAVFLICLVAFPAWVKAGHDFLHRDDFHCVSKEAHVHLGEHHCAACDFYFSPASPSKLAVYRPVSVICGPDEPLLRPGRLSAVAIPHRSLRGPPTVA